ncbi:hypothetical protein [Halogeometricum borinquense]|uniref:hypothetical protein n=1 Tax=Halogeometricum borinquense TaxID=60847 RepID=UPI0034492B4B
MASIEDEAKRQARIRDAFTCFFCSLRLVVRYAVVNGETCLVVLCSECDLGVGDRPDISTNTKAEQIEKKNYTCEACGIQLEGHHTVQEKHMAGTSIDVDLIKRVAHERGGEIQGRLKELLNLANGRLAEYLLNIATSNDEAGRHDPRIVAPACCKCHTYYHAEDDRKGTLSNVRSAFISTQIPIFRPCDFDFPNAQRRLKQLVDITEDDYYRVATKKIGPARIYYLQYAVDPDQITVHGNNVYYQQFRVEQGRLAEYCAEMHQCPNCAKWFMAENETAKSHRMRCFGCTPWPEDHLADEWGTPINVDAVENIANSLRTYDIVEKVNKDALRRVQYYFDLVAVEGLETVDEVLRHAVPRIAEENDEVSHSWAVPEEQITKEVETVMYVTGWGDGSPRRKNTADFDDQRAESRGKDESVRYETV